MAYRKFVRSDARIWSLQAKQREKLTAAAKHIAIFGHKIGSKVGGPVAKAVAKDSLYLCDQAINAYYDYFNLEAYPDAFTEDQLETVRNNTKNNGNFDLKIGERTTQFRYDKLLSNSKRGGGPLTDMALSFDVIPNIDIKAHTVTSTIRATGPDIKFIEYGTGERGKMGPYSTLDQTSISGTIPQGWVYNSGRYSQENIDPNTGLHYWTYKGIGHVGNRPAFVIQSVMNNYKNSNMNYSSTKGGYVSEVSRLSDSKYKQSLAYEVKREVTKAFGGKK